MTSSTAKAQFNYPYALDLLERLNRLLYNGEPLPDLFEHDGYNWWQAYQQNFFTHTKAYSRNRSFTPLRLSAVQRLKRTAFGLVGWLVSRVSLRLARRPDVLIYSVDKHSGSYGNDFRINPTYEFLHQNKLSYLEIFHTQTLGQLWAGLKKRRRPALYLHSYINEQPQVHEIDFDKIDWSEFSSDEQPFAQYLVRQAMSYFATIPGTLRRLEKDLRRLQPQHILLIDDPRHYQPIIVAARKLSIPTIAIQHGHNTRYHVGWKKMGEWLGKAIAADWFVVWSDYWRDIYIGNNCCSPADTILVGSQKQVQAPTPEV